MKVNKYISAGVSLKDAGKKMREFVSKLSDDDLKSVIFWSRVGKIGTLMASGADYDWALVMAGAFSITQLVLDKKAKELPEKAYNNAIEFGAKYLNAAFEIHYNLKEIHLDVADSLFQNGVKSFERFKSYPNLAKEGEQIIDMINDIRQEYFSAAQFYFNSINILQTQNFSADDLNKYLETQIKIIKNNKDYFSKLPLYPQEEKREGYDFSELKEQILKNADIIKIPPEEYKNLFIQNDEFFTDFISRRMLSIVEKYQEKADSQISTANINAFKGFVKSFNSRELDAFMTALMEQLDFAKAEGLEDFKLFSPLLKLIKDPLIDGVNNTNYLAQTINKLKKDQFKNFSTYPEHIRLHLRHSLRNPELEEMYEKINAQPTLLGQKFEELKHLKYNRETAKGLLYSLEGVAYTASGLVSGVNPFDLMMGMVYTDLSLKLFLSPHEGEQFSVPKTIVKALKPNLVKIFNSETKNPLIQTFVSGITSAIGTATGVSPENYVQTSAYAGNLLNYKLTEQAIDAYLETVDNRTLVTKGYEIFIKPFLPKEKEEKLSEALNKIDNNPKAAPYADALLTSAQRLISGVWEVAVNKNLFMGALRAADGISSAVTNLASYLRSEKTAEAEKAANKNNGASNAR